MTAFVDTSAWNDPVTILAPCGHFFVNCVINVPNVHIVLDRFSPKLPYNYTPYS